MTNEADNLTYTGCDSDDSNNPGWYVRLDGIGHSEYRVDVYNEQHQRIGDVCQVNIISAR